MSFHLTSRCNPAPDYRVVIGCNSLVMSDMRIGRLDSSHWYHLVVARRVDRLPSVRTIDNNENNKRKTTEKRTNGLTTEKKDS